MSLDDEEALLRDAWFEAEGVARRPVLLLHPEDDMARPEILHVPPVQRGFFYMKTGHDALRVLENVLRHAGRDMDTVDALLDFASGYGRMTRFLARALDPRRIWASDILAPAVEFQTAELGVNGFLSRADPHALALPRPFPVVYAGSLFSHLPRTTFAGFLRVLYEGLAPDGLLVFSTHSPLVIDPARRDTSGFTFEFHSESRVLDPAQYGTTYVEPAVVRRIAEQLGIAHLWHLDRELWRIQDVYVAARRRVEGLEDWHPAPVATGCILRADLDARGKARAEGYLRVQREAEVGGIEIVVDGRETFGTAHRENPDLSAREGGDHLRQLDWYVEGPAPHLGRGVHTVAAVVELAGGVRRCFDVTLLGRRG